MEVAHIEISHPDKLLFPEDHISKKDVADYYSKIAQDLLPFVKDRPITMKRYTEGINHEGFFNKHRPDYFPDFVEDFQVPTRETEGIMHMVGVHSEKALVYLANQNVIELHAALSTMSALEKPDQMIFDFDPSDNDFEKVRTAAKGLKQLLDEMGLKSFVKTTGSRGLHVHIPIKPVTPFDEVKKLAKQMASKLQQQYPDITTLEQRKNKRGNKVFIDILRNDYGMTTIAPYSLRAKQGAPLATPLNWSEVDDPSLTAQTYHLKNIFRRLAQIDNPWKDFNRSNRQIDLNVK